jgi:hypothetical protein
MSLSIHSFILPCSGFPVVWTKLDLLNHNCDQLVSNHDICSAILDLETLTRHWIDKRDAYRGPTISLHSMVSDVDLFISTYQLSNSRDNLPRPLRSPSTASTPSASAG